MSFSKIFFDWLDSKPGSDNEDEDTPSIFEMMDAVILDFYKKSTNQELWRHINKINKLVGDFHHKIFDFDFFSTFGPKKNLIIEDILISLTAFSYEKLMANGFTREKSLCYAQFPLVLRQIYINTCAAIEKSKSKQSASESLDSYFSQKEKKMRGDRNCFDFLDYQIQVFEERKAYAGVLFANYREALFIEHRQEYPSIIEEIYDNEDYLTFVESLLAELESDYEALIVKLLNEPNEPHFMLENMPDLYIRSEYNLSNLPNR